MVEDLGLRHDADFESLLAHDIVQALQHKRGTSLEGTSSVGPLAGADTLWVLRQGNDHRGTTWFDVEENVVWLCAYGWHRSGQPGDAFQYFAGLISARRIRPTAGDYEALGDERAERFAAVVAVEAQELLATARANPEIEHRRVIGRSQPAGMIVRLILTAEETFVAVFGDTTDLARLQMLLVALYPNRGFLEWRYEQRLPTRELDHRRGELCFSIVSE